MQTETWCQIPIMAYVSEYDPEWGDARYAQRRIITVSKDNVAGAPTIIPVRIPISVEIGDMTEAIVKGHGSAVLLDEEENECPLEMVILVDINYNPIAFDLFFLASTLSSEADTHFVLYYDDSRPWRDEYLSRVDRLWRPPTGGNRKTLVAHRSVFGS